MPVKRYEFQQEIAQTNKENNDWLHSDNYLNKLLIFANLLKTTNLVIYFTAIYTIIIVLFIIS